jgi:predicted secreted acid phosphatase
MSGSWTYLDQQVAAEGDRRLAINLDIDNTSLATYYDRGKPVARVLRFTRHARSEGVQLLFNTGRLTGGGRMARATRQLEAAGYVVTEICGRRSGESLTHSKQRCRAHFAHEGYTLVANVGNRSTDFTGSGYQRAYRLPNYGNQLG